MAEPESSPQVSGPPHLLHLYGWDLGAHENFKGPKSNGQGQLATRKTQWLLEGKDILFPAKVKTPRLRNLRIPSGALPCSLWNLGKEIQCFVTLFLSFAPHSCFNCWWLSCVLGLNNNCQEFRGNKLAKDILLLTWKKKWQFFNAHGWLHGKDC